MQWARVPASPDGHDEGGHVDTDTPVRASTDGSALAASPNSGGSPLNEMTALHTAAGRFQSGLSDWNPSRNDAPDGDETAAADAVGVFDPRQTALSAPATNRFRVGSRRFPCCRFLNPLLRHVPKLQAIQLLKLAAPNALGLLLTFMLNTVNLAFVGHLNDPAALAGAALGNSFMNLTGYAVMMGLCSSVDTLCAQSFGAGQKQLVGLVAQRAAVAYTLVLLPILAVWLYTEQLLLLAGQEAGVSALAGSYVRWAAATLLPSLYCEVCKRYLQAQAITVPQIWISAAANLVHAFLCWLLVFRLEMGLIGAPLAFNITWWAMMLMYFAYVRWGSARVYRSTCPSGGWEWRAVCAGWGQLFALGVPGMLMLLSEWGSFELTALASGWIGSVQIDTLVLLSNVTVAVFMVPLSLAISASTLVGNALGAAQPDQARLFARAALMLAFGFVLLELALVTAARDHVASVFTSDPEVLAEFRGHIWYLFLLLPFDCVQCVQGGVMRGAGFQALGARTNLASYYLFGLPTGFALAFWEPAGKLGLTGLLLGLVIAVLCSAVVYTYKLRSVDWDAESARALARVEEERGATTAQLPLGTEAEEFGEEDAADGADFAALRRHGAPLSDDTAELYLDVESNSGREHEHETDTGQTAPAAASRLSPSPHRDDADHEQGVEMLATSSTRAGGYARAAQEAEEDVEGVNPSARTAFRPSGPPATSHEALPVAAAVVRVDEKFSANEVAAKKSAEIPSDSADSGLSVGPR